MTNEEITALIVAERVEYAATNQEVWPEKGRIQAGVIFDCPHIDVGGTFRFVANCRWIAHAHERNPKLIETIEWLQERLDRTTEAALSESEGRQSCQESDEAEIFRLTEAVTERDARIAELEALAQHEHKIAADRLKRLLQDGSEPVREILDSAVGWASPQNQVQCDCHTKSPTWPIARDQYHLESCPWYYVVEYGNALLSLERQLAERDARIAELEAALVESRREGLRAIVTHQDYHE